jgi:4-hydroxy-3-methylbut-2-enyl diphosphate reductase
VEVVYFDTVCSPTKDRQTALHELCHSAELIFAIGGKNSNNTAQLARTALKLGCKAYHIEEPNDIRPEWLDGIRKIGVTAGTSTLDQSLEAVVLHLQALANTQKSFARFTPKELFH